MLRAAAATRRALSSPALAVASASESVLANGSRVAFKVSSGSGTTTVAVDAAHLGARSDMPHQTGIGALHAAASIKENGAEIKAMGGHVTATPGREGMRLRATVLPPDAAAAAALLAKIATTAPSASSVEAVRARVLAAAECVNSSPACVLDDYLHEAAYLESSIGQPLFGKPSSVAAIRADDIAKGAMANISGCDVTVGVAGAACDQKSVEASVEKGLSATRSASPGDVIAAPTSVSMFTGSDVRIRFDKEPLAHVSIAFEGPEASSPDTIPMQVLAKCLGSWSEASGINGKNLAPKLTIDLCERELVKSYETFNRPYSDTALFGINLIAADNCLESATWYMCSNMVRCAHTITDAEVARAKVALKAEILEREQTSVGAADSLVDGLVGYARMMTTEERLGLVDAVDTKDVKRVTMKYVVDMDHVLAASGPIHELPDYNWIRRRCIWYRY